MWFNSVRITYSGGRNVEIESGYYRQFGENDNPIHNQTDENGNVISNSLRSSSKFTHWFMRILSMEVISTPWSN